MARKILKEGEKYTFRRYFELKFLLKDILAELDTILVKERLIFPTAPEDVISQRAKALKQNFLEVLPLVNLTSEMARREVLVAPILLEVAKLTKSSIDIEYYLEVNNFLRGDLDYYLRSASQAQKLLVVEAKNADLVRGLNQLAVELLAVAQWAEIEGVVYGAVTTGDIWQFARYEVSTRTITQDLTLYVVPDKLTELLRVLVGVLGH